MDGSPLYPLGHHPVRTNYSSNGVYEINPLSRQEHPVKYYFIDFGLSCHFKPGDSPLVVGTKGRDKEPPELSDKHPYNPFQLDIFILGNVYLQEFVQVCIIILTSPGELIFSICQKYHGFEFLQPLVAQMRQRDPNQRPTAQAALTVFQGIKADLRESTLRWRLRSREESAPERVVYDTVAVAREGIYRIKKMIV